MQVTLLVFVQRPFTDMILRPNACSTGLLAALVCMCFLDASAQLVQPNVRMIDTRGGLSHGQVNAMAKDKRGYMWFGTADGLNRFSGARVKVYKSDGTPGTLPNDEINALLIDSGGLLYIGTTSGFLTVLDPQQDTLVNIALPNKAHGDMEEARITALFLDRDGRIWVGHGIHALSLFDPRTRSFRTADVSVMMDDPHERNFIGRILQDQDGSLWLGMERGLAHFDPSTFAQVPIAGSTSGTAVHGSGAVEALLDDGTELLVGTHDGGLLALNKHSGTINALWPAHGTTERVISVQDLLRKDSDHVWVATLQKGLLLFNMRTGSTEHFDRTLDPMRSLDRSDLLVGARCLLGDEEGSLWVGTLRSGAAVIAGRTQRFSLFALPSVPGDSLIDAVVRIAIDPLTGQWLVLTRRHGLYILNTAGVAIARISALRNGNEGVRFHDMRVTDDGTAWVASSMGLLVADRESLRFREPDIAIAAPACSGSLSELWPDGDHGFWCLGQGGLFRLDLVTGKCTSIAEYAPGIDAHLGKRIRAVLMDGHHRLWIGQGDRPLVIAGSDRSFTVLRGTEGQRGGADVAIADLAEGIDGTVWAATYTDGLLGVAIGDDGKPSYRSVKAKDGLNSNMLYAVHVDDRGVVHGTSKGGLFRYDPVTEAATHFEVRDGLPAADLKLGFDRTADGKRMFVRLHEGFLTFTSDQLTEDHAPSVQIPRVSLPNTRAGGMDQLLRGNADMASKAPMLLQYDQHQLNFDLRSTNLLDPFNDVYAYRLMDTDTAWTFTPAQERFTFSHLVPGDYTFEVKARTGHGRWGAVTRVSFIISPPFWGTWWFRAVALLFISALTYLAFRAYLYMRLRQQRETHEREQAVMQERIRIASDMHDDLGSGLSVIKSSSEIALMNETDPGRTAMLEGIAHGSGELIDSMRQIVWTLGSGQESLADLFAYLRHYSANYLERHGVGCVFNVHEPLPELRLSSIERRNLLLIVKEALHNVVKHAHATEVTVSLYWKKGAYLELVDNGRGMGANGHASFGMGLNTMRKRAEQLQGSMEVIDRSLSPGEGAGTRLRFRFPVLGSTERSIARI